MSARLAARCYNFEMFDMLQRPADGPLRARVRVALDDRFPPTPIVRKLIRLHPARRGKVLS